MSPDIAKELERLHAIDGALRASDVVDAARDEDSPLHAYFEWDDGKAAEAHRLNQARALIRSVRVIVSVSETTVQTVNYIRHPDKPKNEQGYASFQQLVADGDARQAALAEEFARAGAALGRARTMAKAFGLADDVESVIEAVAVLQEKLRRTSDERVGVAA